MEPTELPAALVSVLGFEGLRQAWTNLSPRDRAQYATWIANARSESSARRRAILVADRLQDGLGWASPIRRGLHHYLSIPRSTTAADAARAEIGGGPFGNSPSD